MYMNFNLELNPNIFIGDEEQLSPINNQNLPQN